jgi:hypothetical protein
VVSSGQGPAHNSSPLTYIALGNEGAEGAPLGSSLGGSFRSKSLIRQAALPPKQQIPCTCPPVHFLALE